MNKNLKMMANFTLAMAAVVAMSVIPQEVEAAGPGMQHRRPPVHEFHRPRPMPRPVVVVPPPGPRRYDPRFDHRRHDWRRVPPPRPHVVHHYYEESKSSSSDKTELILGILGALIQAGQNRG